MPYGSQVRWTEHRRANWAWHGAWLITPYWIFRKAEKTEKTGGLFKGVEQEGGEAPAQTPNGVEEGEKK